MITVFSDFNGRVGEVDGYFRFVLRLAREEVSLLEANTGGAAFSQSEHIELLKTLKAACYLLLYNLVESTMQNAVEAIFEELRVQSVVFDDCRDELKEEILKNFRSRNVGKLLPRLVTLARDVVHATFEKKETFSGNLDARTIRKTAKRFGFDEPHGSQFALLQTIKDGSSVNFVASQSKAV